MERFIEEHRRRRQAFATALADLLSMLLGATDSECDGAAMTDAQLRDECLTIFTAGHETTANALTFTCYLLGTNPDRPRRSSSRNWPRVLAGRLPAFEDVDRLPYTRAVVAESMRLYPPAWGMARQAIAM